MNTNLQHRMQFCERLILSKIKRKFSTNLKNIREKKNLTQEELAEILGISLRYVQTLEGKNCPNVKLETLEKLAKVLKVKPSSLIAE